MSQKATGQHAWCRGRGRAIRCLLGPTLGFVLACAPAAHANTLASDPTFGDAGSATASTKSGGAGLFAVLLTPGGIYLGGHAGGQGPAIVRFTESGLPAEGWGVDGVLTPPTVHGAERAQDFVAGLVTRSDGQIVAIHHVDIGTDTERPLACPVQYTPRGQVDTTFTASCLSWDEVAGGLWSRHNSRLTLFGADVDGRTVVAQLDRHGKLVKGFGHYGRVVLGRGWGPIWMRGVGDTLLFAAKQAFALESVSLSSGRTHRLGELAARRRPDRPIRVAGVFRIGQKTLIEAFDVAHTQIFTVRFDSRGKVDRRYGHGGIAATPRMDARWSQVGVSRIRDLLVVQEGPQQVDAETCSRPLRVLAVNKSGRVDPKFGTSGIEPLTRTLGCGGSEIESVQTDSRQRLVIGGVAQQPDLTTDFFVDRFVWDDGTRAVR